LTRALPSPARPRAFAARLVAWQKSHGRHGLPWQRSRDAYRVWLSEIMLQQTQVATVVPYYERFVAAFPDVRLHAAAKAVVGVHGGAFPREPEALAALPGIGRSTAAAIAAFAFGARAAILDGNVKRVLARHRGVEGYPGAPKVEATLWTLAESLLPEREVATYTQALMDLGATVCTRAKPACGACPVARDCVARRDGRTGELPSPRPRKALPQRSIRVLVLERAGTVLLEKRPPTGIWAGLWSLPEAAVDADVDAHCRKRFGAGVTLGAELAPIEHGFTHYRLTIHPQRVRVRSWPTRAEAPGAVWLTREDALAAALPAPVRAILRAL
jgi:A/G-specific adenine glycosylase